MQVNYITMMTLLFLFERSITTDAKCILTLPDKVQGHLIPFEAPE